MRHPRYPLQPLLFSILAILLAFFCGRASAQGSRRISFTYSPGHTVSSVVVAGDFNRWSLTANPMSPVPGSPGSYRAEIDIPAPGRYEYKFVVDATHWVADPARPPVADSRGEFGNSVLVLDPVTTATLAVSPTPLAPANSVTVRISYTTHSEEDISLLWGINGWKEPPAELAPGDTHEFPKLACSPLRMAGQGRWVVDLQVPSGTTLDYAFRIRRPFERWDNNGGDGIDYHTTVNGPTEVQVTWNQGGAGDDPRLARRFARGGALLMAASLLLALAMMGRKGADAWRSSRPLRVAVALTIGVVAFCLRLPHLCVTAEEIDETDYVPLAMGLAHHFREGDIRAAVNRMEVSEHPRLGLTLFAGAILASGGPDSIDDARLASRIVSAGLAAGCAVALAWWFPVAGWCWAVFGLGLHYTSLAYLDSTMTFFATVCVLTFNQVWRRPVAGEGIRASSTVSWLLVSAACAGATMSSKYLGVVAPLTVLVGFALWTTRIGARASSRRVLGIFLAYVVMAVAFMILTDIHLWTTDAPRRIWGRLVFHRNFSQGEVVHGANFGTFQPVVWLWNYLTVFRAEGVLVWPWLDRSIVCLGVVGLLAGIRREPLLVVAAVVTVGFLFLWPTKWPQYEVILLPWLCVGTEFCVRWVLGSWWGGGGVQVDSA